MSYWQLFYQAVWATKHREPVITPEAEPIIYEFMRAKAEELGGVVFAVNGMADHVHLVLAIQPRIAVAEMIGQVKGVTSAKYNSRLGAGMARLAWQGEYGVFSFDSKRLSNVIAYINNQKVHHAEATVIPVLERWDEGGVWMVGESDALYGAEDEAWRSEMNALLAKEGAATNT